MPITGTCTEVFYLTLPEEIELDAAPASREEVVGAYREQMRPMPADTHVDVDVDDNVF